MSICSIVSSWLAPAITVSTNGYRLETSRSKGAIPSSVSWARCDSSRVSASRPACTNGCSVLTRPSRHSGNPVSCSTWVTGTPASARVRAVDPVETISTPDPARARPTSTRPVLS